MHGWLRGQLARNRPWDELAREVLTASGDTTASPAVGYFVVTVGEKRQVEESEVADSVAQAFLGTRIGCAKCHNHPLEKYTQDDYYHFAAYFSKVSLKRVQPAEGPTVLTLMAREEAERQKEIERVEKSLAEAKRAAEGKPATSRRRRGRRSRSSRSGSGSSTRSWPTPGRRCRPSASPAPGRRWPRSRSTGRPARSSRAATRGRRWPAG
jgi:hypothetical protein